MLSFVVTLETLTPPATALAAAEAAGMPVRRPRRPAAVSAADAADAERATSPAPPSTSGPPNRPSARGGASWSVCMCVSASLSVGRVWSGDRPPVLVSSVWDRLRAASGFPIPAFPIRGFWCLVSSLRVSRSICDCVSACRSTRLLRRVAPLFFPSASFRSFSAELAR